MGGGHAFKGGGGRMGGGGKAHAYSGGGKSKGHGYSGKGHVGNWNKNYYSNDHGKYGHYRRGYPWYGVYAYGGGGCGWLYSRAITTGSAYWWDRYYQCTGY